MKKKITGRLFIREEYETEYRDWDELSEEQKKEYSERLQRQMAKACGLVEVTKN